MKKKSLAWYKKKLWLVFSKYIKENERNVCFTCGRKVEGQGSHAGHLFPKSTCNVEAYFSEINVHCQCFYCNINLGGNGAVYRKLAEKKYGIQIIEDLEKNRKSPIKWSEDFYKEKIEFYGKHKQNK